MTKLIGARQIELQRVFVASSSDLGRFVIILLLANSREWIFVRVQICSSDRFCVTISMVIDWTRSRLGGLFSSPANRIANWINRHSFVRLNHKSHSSWFKATDFCACRRSIMHAVGYVIQWLNWKLSESFHLNSNNKTLEDEKLISFWGSKRRKLMFLVAWFIARRLECKLISQQHLNLYCQADANVANAKGYGCCLQD